MRSKHYGNTPRSWLRQLAREIGVVSVLSISLIGNAYGPGATTAKAMTA